MSKFDEYIRKIFQEGLDNMGPAVGPAASTPKPSSSSPTGATSTSSTPTAASGAKPMDNDTMKVLGALGDKNTKWTEWLGDPSNKKTFDSHIQKVMFDPKGDPSSRENLLGVISQTPDLQKYVSGMFNGSNA